MDNITPMTPQIQLAPIVKATHAIKYTLARIANTPELAWRFLDTEAYDQLINAYAALTEQTVDSVRSTFRPRDSFCCRACVEREQQ